MSNEEHQIITERRNKLVAWRQNGDAYPNDFQPTHQCDKLYQTYGNKSVDELSMEKIDVKVAGRLMLRRVMGKASFATIQDGSGQIQIYVNDKNPNAQAHEAFRHWDIGDIIAITGVLFKTRTGELTIECHHLRLLSKCLRPLPEKFHGLTDVEQRQRQRHLDLIINKNSRHVVLLRSQTITTLRSSLIEKNFIEVETPMMHRIPGGATARPFLTHHHALDMDLFLRIAPELYLKRLVVGGLERVFELNRNFRNEGISTRHNPEFTMLEFYQAYSNHHGMMTLTEELLHRAVQLVSNDQQINYQGRILDFSRPFPRIPMLEAIQRHGYSSAQLQDEGFLRRTLADRQMQVPPSASLPSLQLLLFEEMVEPTLHDPVFITDYPLEVSPLARASTEKPEIAERFELFIAGREIANGFSELNDPENQADRLHQQAKEKSAGEHLGMYYDEEYIQALEYALPPTGGCGIGVDRLVMLLADKANIRDVILFPLLRPNA